MIKKLTFLTILFFTINSIAQKNNISPYSFFGIGESNETQSVSEANMGGIGGSLNSPYMLYFTNPASYASLRLTTYAFAGNNKYLIIDDGNESQGSSSFNLSYLALGFPVGKKAGVVFGAQPSTKVGYSILNTLDDTETNLFSGNGGTNRVFLGYGYQLPFNINLGIEGSYEFGNIQRRILNRRANVYLASMYETISNISGFSLKAGIQNDIKVNDKLNVKTGITLHIENDLKTRGSRRLYSLLNVIDPNLIIERDVVLNESFNSEINSPLKTIISAGIGTNRWFTGFEYSFQNPILFKNEVLQSPNVEFTASSRMSLGGFYTPRIESLTNYFQRITYRAGFYSKQLGLKINNTEIKDFGMSFGLTLPSKRKFSNINLGIDIGQRGEKRNNLIKENYINFRLNLSFTDKWFKKRKLN
ncbi:MAG: hypothetical protein L3J23_07860 [Flavobacteriaceae bacterium]|nr:hypothetical protein [Flavobacteriaceae bacterium]